MGVHDDIQATASQRRRLVAEALSRELDPDVTGSTAADFASLLDQPRSMLVSADIDGLVTAAMIASVAPDWKIIGFVQRSQAILHHPHYKSLPDDVFGVDLFSPRFDCISNHPVLFGEKAVRRRPLRTALRAWDDHVHDAATSRTFVVPSLWAGIQAGYEDGKRPTSAKYKYPLGSAQMMLALLEVLDRAPKFYDRALVPWLVANCDGGAASHGQHGYNTSVWWATMAAIAGPGSLTERVYDKADTMRPNDLHAVLNALNRERLAEGKAPVLKDDWNMIGASAKHLQETLAWLVDLTVWADPVRDGLNSIEGWIQTPMAASGFVYINGATDADAAAKSLETATQTAVNANFYVGGQAGSRFNWVGL